MGKSKKGETDQSMKRNSEESDDASVLKNNKGQSEAASTQDETVGEQFKDRDESAADTRPKGMDA